MLSTRRGRRGMFYEEFHRGAAHGSNDKSQEGHTYWEKYHVVADEIPTISEAFLSEERAILPPAIFEQEYYGAFLEGDSQFFTLEEVDAMTTDEFEPFYPEEQE